MASPAVMNPSAVHSDSHRQSMYSTSSHVSSSAASFRTAPMNGQTLNDSSRSSSAHTLGPSNREPSLDAGVNPISTLAANQEVHIVKVTGDTVELETGPMQDSFIHKVGNTITNVVHGQQNGHHVGPPPPSPPPSVDHHEGVLAEPSKPEGSSTIIYEEPESINSFPSSSRDVKFTDQQYPPSIPSEFSYRSSSETKTSMSTLRSNTMAPTTKPSRILDDGAGGESSSPLSESPVKSLASPDGHLLPPPVTGRPTRRNTTGSTPRATTSTSPHHRTSALHSKYNSQPFIFDENDVEVGEQHLASDIEAHAEQIRRERMSKRAKQQQEAEAALTKPKVDENSVLVGNLIGEDHVNYVLMYNMLTGIRIGVSRCQAKIKRPLTPEDFKAAHKFSFDIVGNELTPSAKYDFKFKDYASWVFRELREDYFHLDPADYLLSLTAKYILSELGSPGKSGSFFYFSRDYRFIIKTIRHSEAKFLLSILPQYYEHVKSNPHTLLSQFYGLHRIKLPRGRKIHFVIMNNLFPPHRDIHETFDLKGSTVGREYPEEKAAKNPRAVMKDLNWITRERQMELGPEKRALLTEQLRRDAEFLKKIQVMDYSLLIGIHNMQRGNRDNVRKNTLKVFSPEIPLRRRNTQLKGGTSPEAVALRKAMRQSDPKRLGKGTIRLPEQDTGDRQQFIFYQDEGGLRATDDQNDPLDTIYYLGVIDILTPYTTAKKLEHVWKGMQADRHKISPVPPTEYADRFFAFMKAVMRGGEGGARFKAE